MKIWKSETQVSFDFLPASSSGSLLKVKMLKVSIFDLWLSFHLNPVSFANQTIEVSPVDTKIGIFDTHCWIRSLFLSKYIDFHQNSIRFDYYNVCLSFFSLFLDKNRPSKSIPSIGMGAITIYQLLKYLFMGGCSKLNET